MCHLDRLDVLTSLDAILKGRHSTQNTTSVVSEAMSEKKIHEVGIMVDAVSFLYRITHSDLVSDNNMVIISNVLRNRTQDSMNVYFGDMHKTYYFK